MTNYYTAPKKDNKEYETYFYASKELANEVGSGSNVNGQLIQTLINGKNSWPISRQIHQLPDFNVVTTNYGVWDVYAISPSQEEEDRVLTIVDKLNDIRDTFGISILHLASVLGVSRTSLHSWLEGAVPRDQYVVRIDQILEVTQAWKEMSQFHYSPGRLMRQPLGKGPSMLERMEREVLDEAELEDGLERLAQLMLRQRKVMDRSKKHSRASKHPDKVKKSTRLHLTKTVY